MASEGVDVVVVFGETLGSNGVGGWSSDRVVVAGIESAVVVSEGVVLGAAVFGVAELEVFSREVGGFGCLRFSPMLYF